MEKRIIDFYRRCIFGKNYDITDKTNIDMIVKCCFTNAWKDMARTYPIEDDESRTNLKINMLADLTKQVKAKKYNPRAIIKKYTGFNNLSLGQSQKVINMFFKYLYTFYDVPDIKPEFFIDCDCPIDSIIINRLREKQENNKFVVLLRDKIKYKNKIYKWSNLDNFDCYVELQELIETLSPTTKLDFDFNEWK